MKTSRRLTVWVIWNTCYSRVFAVVILFCFGKNILQNEECWCPWIMTITHRTKKENTHCPCQFPSMHMVNIWIYLLHTIEFTFLIFLELYIYSWDFHTYIQWNIILFADNFPQPSLYFFNKFPSQHHEISPISSPICAWVKGTAIL